LVGEELPIMGALRSVVEWLWLALIGVITYIFRSHKARTDTMQEKIETKADHAAVKELTALVRESIDKAEARAVSTQELTRTSIISLHEKIERSNSELSHKLDQRYADLRGSIDDTNKAVLGLALNSRSSTPHG
jgi:hypothetical protein